MDAVRSITGKLVDYHSAADPCPPTVNRLGGSLPKTLEPIPDDQKRTIVISPLMVDKGLASLLESLTSIFGGADWAEDGVRERSRRQPARRCPVCARVCNVLYAGPRSTGALTEAPAHRVHPLQHFFRLNSQSLSALGLNAAPRSPRS